MDSITGQEIALIVGIFAFLIAFNVALLWAACDWLAE